MKKALIVIDMLKDFINKDGALYCGEMTTKMVPHVVARVKEYNDNELPIIFVCDNHNENDLEFERFPKHCVAFTDGASLIKELEHPTVDNIAHVYKNRFSGFHNTNLDFVLSEFFGMKPNDSVIEVCGVCTHICVSDTVGDLTNRNYHTVINRRCVGDFDKDMHTFALKRMKNIYGTEII